MYLIAMLNTHNSPTRQAVVAAASIGLAAVLYVLGYDYQEVAAAVPYILLSLMVILGPRKTKTPGDIWERLAL